MQTEFSDDFLLAFLGLNWSHDLDLYELTAYPLTAAITGFLVSASLVQWLKKLPPNTSLKSLSSISLISAPAAQDNQDTKINRYDTSITQAIGKISNYFEPYIAII